MSNFNERSYSCFSKANIYFVMMMKVAKLGVLGGSFNPPHFGHLYLTRYASFTLSLDKAMWLITPQNPMKPSNIYIDFEKRVDMCLKLIEGSSISLSLLEKEEHLSQTVDSLKILSQRNKKYRLVWLMGADNLYHFDTWDRWTEIFNYADVAVFDRENIISKCHSISSVVKAKDASLPLSLHKMENIDISSSEIRQKIDIFGRGFFTYLKSIERMRSKLEKYGLFTHKGEKV